MPTGNSSLKGFVLKFETIETIDLRNCYRLGKVTVWQRLAFVFALEVYRRKVSVLLTSNCRVATH